MVPLRGKTIIKTRIAALIIATAIIAVIVYTRFPHKVLAGCANDGDPGCPPMAQAIVGAAAADKVCQQDSDCSMVAFGCVGCGVSGGYDAVNKVHAADYKAQASCTAAEIEIMARTDCVQVSTPAPICQNQQCAVQWTKIKR